MEKFEAIWQELWAWVYKVLAFFGLDAANMYKGDDEAAAE